MKFEFTGDGLKTIRRMDMWKRKPVEKGSRDWENGWRVGYSYRQDNIQCLVSVGINDQIEINHQKSGEFNFSMSRFNPNDAFQVVSYNHVSGKREENDFQFAPRVIELMNVLQKNMPVGNDRNVIFAAAATIQ